MMRTYGSFSHAPLTTVGLVLFGLAVAALPSRGSADCSATVTAGADPDAALRGALAAAPAAAVADDCADWTIHLSGAFPLSAELVWGTDLPLRLVGPADGTARIDVSAGFGDHRILRVATTRRVTLERLVLAGGDVSGAAAGADEGGAVHARDLRLIDVELTGNAAVAGGAVLTVDLTAIRTTFVGNTAESLVGEGGAVLATGDVVLENVTFLRNRAKLGGAMLLDLSDGSLHATFVTFRDNAAFTADGGADLHLFADDPGGSVVTLRGVLLGGVLTGIAPDTSTGPSCAGDSGILVARTGFTWTDSLASDASCGAPVGSVIARPEFTTVTWLAGMTALAAPVAGSAPIDLVACGVGWPGTDQRGTTRPQGTAGRCDAGAVERIVVTSGGEDSGSVEEPEAEAAGGPIPTSIPAGGGE